MSFVGDLRAVLRHRDFRRLFATRLTSQAADGAFQVALASLFFFSPERQTSAGSVAAAFATLLLPYSLVGPFAGVLLDRWRRRKILVVANLLRTVMVLGVAGLSAADVTGVPLYAAVLACLSVNRFFLAGLSAALPHVVSRDELVMANSVSTTTGTIVALTGGGIGFGLKKLFGEGNTADAVVIVVAALVYALAAGIAARMDRDLLGPDLDSEPPATRAAVRRVARGLVDGARHVLAPPVGRARARGHRRAPVLLRRLDHHRDPAVPDLLQRPGRRRRRARGPGDRRSRRPAPGSSLAAVITPRRRSGCASRPGSSSASRWPPSCRPCSSLRSASGCCWSARS